jgi:hypothetical protein
MEALEKIQLAERTRHRNDGICVAIDWGGLLDPLESQQAALNTLARATIENYMAASDEAWDIKAGQRDQTNRLNWDEVNQERALAEAKIATERTKLAIKLATDEYTLAVRQYESKVKGLLQDAKDFAALVERQALAIEGDRLTLAISKEDLHQKDVQAQIYYEMIQRAQVEADLARAQVDVAKANVRAIMADIEAGKAQVDLVEAQVQVFMAEAEKATLQADVATIFAEIMTKQISSIKLGAEKAQISAEMASVQNAISAAIMVYEARGMAEQVKIQAEQLLLAEASKLLAAQEAELEIKILESEQELAVLAAIDEKTQAEIGQEKALMTALTANRIALVDARTAKSVATENARTSMESAVNLAYIATYLSKTHLEYRTLFSTEKLTIY